MTGKISMFGSLADRAAAGRSGAEKGTRRVRHVYVVIQLEDRIVERPGVLLDWVREPLGWVARVAYCADEDGTLIVAWFPAAQLSPVQTV